MSGIETIPTGTIKGYDYNSATWKNIAVNRSGEVGLRRGEILHTQETLLVTSASGGMSVGSGLTTSGYAVDRVILNIPTISQSGTNIYGNTINSGTFAHGVWIGGASGRAPYIGNGFVGSGKGLLLFPSAQKELFVQNLGEIYLVAETSGTPVTVASELIVP